MSDNSSVDKAEKPNEQPLPEARTPREGAWFASRSLLLFSVLAVGLLALIYQAAAPRIAKAEAAEQLRLLQQILPSQSYDNDLLAEILEIELPEQFSTPGLDTIWRARQGAKTTAVIIPATSRDGYSGNIDMLVGVYDDGRIAGVRITQHRETPGLGDAIDIERSNWIRQFDSTSLRAPEQRLWSVRKDGGAFDQLTGATITPRAVTKTIRQVLEFHAENLIRLYTPDPSTPAAAPSPAATPETR